MTLRLGRGAALAALIGAAALSSGCTSIREHQGQLLDEALVSAVQPGVDNRDSVAATLGRPTFVGQFDQHDWYYVSRDTKQLAFGSPKADKQTVLHVRFDEAGNVASVNRTGLEQVASISPMGGKTPTLGRNRSFFDELFGGIGQVGSGQGAGGPTGQPGSPQ
jgi:outer membrane protein assembly factor BamE (lipoprotein component of BamABCDE complex)